MACKCACPQYFYAVWASPMSIFFWLMRSLPSQDVANAWMVLLAIGSEWWFWWWNDQLDKHTGHCHFSSWAPIVRPLACQGLPVSKYKLQYATVLHISLTRIGIHHEYMTIVLGHEYMDDIQADAFIQLLLPYYFIRPQSNFQGKSVTICKE